jgi:hypothetical protein
MKQEFIPGTEPPERNREIEEIEETLYAWLNAKADHRDAFERTRIRHAALIEKLATHGIDRYPYLDPVTGKRKHVVASRETKAKTVAAPKEHKKNRGQVGEEVVAKPFAADHDDDKKLALPAEHSDPFGTTRRTLEAR